MTSNTSSSQWSVRIVPLPPFIDYIRLAQELRLPKSCVYIPKTFDNNTPYAWINGFVDYGEANEFVRQWSGASIQGQQIKCMVSSRRSDLIDSLPSSKESLASGIEPLPNKQRDSGSSTEPKIRRDNSNLPSTTASLKTNDEENNTRKSLPRYHYSNRDRNTFQHPQKSSKSLCTNK
jgi:hypothetical protein